MVAPAQRLPYAGDGIPDGHVRASAHAAQSHGILHYDPTILSERALHEMAHRHHRFVEGQEHDHHLLNPDGSLHPVAIEQLGARDAAIVTLQARLLDHTGHVRGDLPPGDVDRIVGRINALRRANNWPDLNMAGRQ
jgi:hypothetical protein